MSESWAKSYVKNMNRSVMDDLGPMLKEKQQLRGQGKYQSQSDINQLTRHCF